MAVSVATEIVIDRTVEDLAAFAGNPDNAPLWYQNIKAVSWKTPRPLRVGSRIAFEAHFLRRVLVYTYEVTEIEPNRRLVMRTVEGPFPMETKYEFLPLGLGRSRMRLRNRGKPSGFGLLLIPLVAIAMYFANRKDLAKLKRIIESRS